MNQYCRWIRVFPLFLLFLFSPVWAATPAAMLLKTEGEVRLITDETAKPFAPLPFAKLVTGSQLDIPKGASAQLIYFDNGRKETWTGPANIHIGNSASESPSAQSAQVKISQLPTNVGQQIDKLPADIQLASIQRGGLVVVRGIVAPKHEVPTELKEQWKIYQGLRQNNPTDWTADLYWLSALHESGKTSLYEQHLEKTLKRFPEMADYLSKQH